MERLYRNMYRLGLTPWDREQIPAQLTLRIDDADGLEPGVALDLGCGTGRHSAYLVDHGWKVTGVDVAAKAIDQARSRSEQVQWAVADLTNESIRPIEERLRGRATLILDVGCLHGLSDQGCLAWNQTVNTVAAPRALLILRAVSPRDRKAIGPRGIEPEQITRGLGPDWVQVGEPTSNQWFEYQKAAI